MSIKHISRMSPGAKKLLWASMRTQKTALLLSLCAALLATSALAGFAKSKYDMMTYFNSTREQAILDAFSLMEKTVGAPSLDIIVNRPVRVIFKDLRELDKRVKNYDALSYMTSSGQLMIYINAKHANAPAAALAAIISHEALHNDMQNSLHEEIAGWTQEAQVWNDLKKQDPTLQGIKKGTFPLVDRLNVLESHYKDGSMVSFVRGQAAYKGLPETSPGYGGDNQVQLSTVK